MLICREVIDLAIHNFSKQYLRSWFLKRFLCIFDGLWTAGQPPVAGGGKISPHALNVFNTKNVASLNTYTYCRIWHSLQLRSRLATGRFDSVWALNWIEPLILVQFRSWTNYYQKCQTDKNIYIRLGEGLICAKFPVEKTASLLSGACLILRAQPHRLDN